MMQVYKQLKWLYWGSVSKTVVEDIDSTTYAIFFPALLLSLEFALFYAAIALYGEPGIVSRAVSISLSGFALLFSIPTFTTLGASYVYFKQHTELPNTAPRPRED